MEGQLMFSAEVTARLRAVLDEVCASIPKYETDTWTLVACKILETAANGELSIEGLRAAGYRALT
jgi:hypothetical protein